MDRGREGVLVPDRLRRDSGVPGRFDPRDTTGHSRPLLRGREVECVNQDRLEVSDIQKRIGGTGVQNEGSRTDDGLYVDRTTVPGTNVGVDLRVQVWDREGTVRPTGVRSETGRDQSLKSRRHFEPDEEKLTSPSTPPPPS